MVARTVTSQNNLKNMLHLTGSAEMKKVSKFPTCQSYPALPYYARVVLVGHTIVVPNKSYLILSCLERHHLPTTRNM